MGNKVGFGGIVYEETTSTKVGVSGGVFEETISGEASTFQPAWIKNNTLIGANTVSFKKNTAVTGFTIGLVSATDGSDITTGTVTGKYTLDGGTQGTIAGTITHEGSGQWSVNLTAAEMNGDIVGLTFTHASAISAHFTIKTVAKLTSELNDFDAANDDVAVVTLTSTTTTLTGNTAQTGDNYARIGANGAGLTNIDLPNQTMDITGNLSGSVGSVSGDINTASGNITNLDDLDTEQDAQHTITQGAISSIAASPGVGATPFIPDTITVVTGTGASGTTDDLANDGDGNVYTVNDDAGTLTLDFDYELGSGITSIQLILVVAAQGISDNFTLQFYDQVGTAWDDISTILGANSLTYDTFDKVVLAKYTTNTGLFQVRITGTGLTTSTLTIDKAVGYGIAVSGGITNGSTVTLSESTINDNLIGHNWILELGTQDIGGSYISGSKNVSGTGTCENGSGYLFEDCIMESPILSTEGQMKNCLFEATEFTSTSGVIADEIIISGGKSTVSGSASPILTWAAITKETSVNVRGWLGGGTWTFTSNTTASVEVLHGGKHTINTGGGDVEFRGFPREIVIVLSGGETVQVIAGTGPISISGNGTGSTVNIYGSHAGVSNTATGSPSVTDEGLDTGNTATETALSTVDGKLPSSLVSGRMSSDMVSLSGSTTAADNLEASALGIHSTTVSTAASATEFTLTAGATDNDIYIGRIVVVTSGDHAGEATDITDYVGSTKTVTVTAFTGTLTASDDIVIV